MGLQGPDSTSKFSITNPGQTQGFLEGLNYPRLAPCSSRNIQHKHHYLATHTRQDSNMFLSTRTSSLAQRGRLLLRNTHTGPVPGVPRSSRHGYATDKKRAGKSGNFKATGEQPAQPGQPKRVDPNSPEYKAYQRTWTTVMIGTPIILVCSYELWQRLIDGKKPLSLEPKDKTALADLTPHSESPSTTA